MISIRTSLLACALATGLAVSPVVVAAAEQSPTATTSAPATAAIGIDNFGRINETYYRGAQPDGRDYTDLAALGVKTVIDLQEDGLAIERQFVESAGMKFFRIPMNTRRAPTNDDLSRFLQLVNDPAEPARLRALRRWTPSNRSDDRRVSDVARRLEFR